MNKIVVSIAAALALIAIVFTAAKNQDSRPPVAEQVVGLADIAPVPSPGKVIHVVTREDGTCAWVLLEGGYQRACEEQPDWQSLKKVVDRGQYFRGTSLD